LPYNDGMSYLEIILPFGIPPTSLAKELMKQMRTPSLAALLGHAKTVALHEFEELSRQLPHEYWMTRDFDDANQSGLASDKRSTSPALTHYFMQQAGVLPEEGYWFTLSPVHIHVARDHLVMTDPQRLAISEAESRALFDAAESLCTELGHSLIFGDKQTWFLRADPWRNLSTASLQAACGHNMDIWIAKGECEVAWRKLQNEIQMQWHIHPVNQSRADQGLDTINSVWLHSGSEKLQAPEHVFGITKLHDILTSPTPSGAKAVVLDNLNAAYLNNDWGSWLAAMNELEQTCFLPVLQALQSKKMSAVNLVVSDTHRLAIFECKAPQSWKFWRKASLQPLAILAGNDSVVTSTASLAT